MPAPTIQGVATSITAFVAPAPQGPLNAPTLVSSLAQFELNFGAIAAAGALGSAVMLFFANGGTTAVIVRVPQGTPPAVADYGDAAAGTGIYSLDSVPELNLLCLPAVAGDAALYPLYPSAARYCETRQALLLVDPPPGATIAAAEQWMATSGSLMRSRNVAAYFPGLLVADGSGASMTVPASGAVAGVCARIDATRGVWRAPAGTGATISGSLGLALELSDGEATALSALALNCLRSFQGIGTVVWGDRTMAGGDGSTDDFKYVPVRRLVLFIEQSVAAGTRWAVFEPNGPALWAEVAMSVTAFLQQLFAAGAFAGATPQQSYFTRCDNTTMSQSDIDNGRLVIEVGVAPLRPAEFVIFRIGQFLQP